MGGMGESKRSTVLAREIAEARMAGDFGRVAFLERLDDGQGGIKPIGSDESVKSPVVEGGPLTVIGALCGLRALAMNHPEHREFLEGVCALLRSLDALADEAEKTVNLLVRRL